MSKLMLVLRLLLALLFALAATAKLVGAPMMVAEFDAIGLGTWFRYATAACELVGAALLVQARTALFGAVVLIGVCIGALVAQLHVLHGDVIHCIVLAALLAVVGWTYRGAQGVLRLTGPSAIRPGK